ncbi:P-loop containing nucleoside triphosphate hydrolase protein [Lophiotrema nucula]|uniref:P-loop containing nucleoside triphosphate hydrolase protein n=1 Tax=Lophiotrema nucula TaxID=690887 RepID=A0A6A5YMW0_9PLEO|nr:P-loop containing nucleoside triphosphate hydrolase protein [Lophiotrema nucula]
MNDGALFLESFLHSISTDDKGAKSVPSHNASSPYLSVVVYGPMRLYEDVGRFCQSCDLSLQDPLNATLDVSYRNPHRIPATSETPVNLYTLEGFMNGLNASADMLEEDTPTLLETPLLKHQRQALQFMARRENGWDFECPGKDDSYVNNITGESQSEVPPQFFGGILADEMGLGKSLSIISLITHGIEMENFEATSTISVREKNYAVESTLIIVPLPSHYVREASNNTTKALCSLHATSRWVVTGTPLQNRLSDLSTLFTFLRVHPYDSLRTFNDHIVRVWKTRGMSEAASRLRRLLRSIMLRRSQTVIKLPRTSTVLRELDFTHDEWAIYNEAKSRARQVMGSMYQGPFTTQTPTYLNILQQINDLRMICDVGVYHQHAPDDVASAREMTTTWNSADAQALIASVSANVDLFCLSCYRICLGPNVDAINQVLGIVEHTVWMTSCMTLFCSGCVTQSQLLRAGGMIACGHIPLCPLAPINSGYSAGVGSIAPMTPAPYQRILPTKIQALMEDLRVLPLGTKSVVFTFWKSTIEIIQEGLQSIYIPYLRIDGSMSVQNRDSILETFRSPVGYNVLILTISCASVGLDLTAASRVFLMEPHWNPSVEDQALARVHRMGQLSEVVNTRYIIKGSFEENVLKKQQHKKRLAEVLFSQENQDRTATAQAHIEVSFVSAVLS